MIILDIKYSGLLPVCIKCSTRVNGLPVVPGGFLPLVYVVPNGALPVVPCSDLPSVSDGALSDVPEGALHNSAGDYFCDMCPKGPGVPPVRKCRSESKCFFTIFYAPENRRKSPKIHTFSSIVPEMVPVHLILLYISICL